MVDPGVALAAGLVVAAGLAAAFRPRVGLYDRWSRVRRLSTRVLREDALKHILQSEERGTPATIESVAGALGIAADRAAGLLEEMDRADLVEADGGTIRLAPAGRETALHVVRAHRLWERHLADETGFDEAEWHPQADLLEHEISPDEADLLSARLQHPTHDPHGDPIPGGIGRAREGPLAAAGRPLAGLAEGAAARIVHVEDEPEVVYAQLVAQGLTPGTTLRVIESTPRRIRFWANGDDHVLAPVVAANVSVIPLAPDQDADAEPAAFGEPLHALRPGQRARVVRLSPRCRGAERRRFLDLGVLPGTEITAEIVSPTGDPTAYRIRGALIALRRSQAEMVRVELS